MMMMMMVMLVVVVVMMVVMMMMMVMLVVVVVMMVMMMMMMMILSFSKAVHGYFHFGSIDLASASRSVPSPSGRALGEPLPVSDAPEEVGFGHWEFQDPP